MPKRIRHALLLVAALLLAALAWYARPQSLNALIPQTGVTGCSLLLSPTDPSDGGPRVVELEPDGPRYQAMISLLHSTGFRRPLMDLLALGRSPDSHVIALGQTVALHVRTEEGPISLTFYGERITYAPATGRPFDLIPLGGRPFQQKVLALATQYDSR